MRCSFCDTEGHKSLRVIMTPTLKRISSSPTSDPAPSRAAAGACDACLALIHEASAPT